MELYNDDCFNVFPFIKENTVDLFVLDLPYANMKFGKCTACDWDLPIDLDKMWIQIKRTMKPNAVIVFFCNTKFGYALINSNPKWFKYDLIWKKSRKVGFLSANRAPLRQHENIYIFNDKKPQYNPQKTPGKPYKRAAHCRKNMGVYMDAGRDYPQLDIKNTTGDRHPSSVLPDNTVGVCDECSAPQLYNGFTCHNNHAVEEHENLYVFNKQKPTYNPQKTPGKPYASNNKKSHCELYGNKERTPSINTTGDRHPSSILEHENLYIFNQQKPTYNPQKTPGKPYFRKDAGKCALYNKQHTIDSLNATGDRHPSSILENTIIEPPNGTHGVATAPECAPADEEDEPGCNLDIESTILAYNNPAKSVHRTQKPLKLLEWIIKSYTNENDVVMDFCMGSGTAGVAAKALNRQFIGVEREKDIFNIARDRIG